MLRTWLGIVLSLLVAAVTPVWAEPGGAVAHVALAVGSAVRTDALGKTQPLLSGAPLADGDRIITGKDAVAVLVFADEGRISLRADSELIIRRYHIDPSGASTEFSLELVRGALRQISGRGAKLQPERYRLNTPVAAIGVRGTDFLAKASGDSMEAFVHEGMIVVLPGGRGCSGALVGAACAPLAAVSAGDAGSYLRVLPGGGIERRALDSQEVERLFGITVVRRGQGAASSSQGGRAAPNGDEAGASAPSTLATSRATGDWPQSSPSLPVVPIATSSPLADVALPAVPMPTQLVWGRFSNAGQIPLELPRPYVEANQGRHVTVGELGEYALWRSNPTGSLDAGLSGQVAFNLAASEAVFLPQAGPAVAAQLRDPVLTIDFDRARFSTSLTLTSAPTGAVGLNMAGRLNDEGIFTASDSTGRVAGATSLDGKEAGFLFSRSHALGDFRGVTLWKAR